MMSECFPGCKRNLRQMVELMFGKKGVDPQKYLDALDDYQRGIIGDGDFAEMMMASIFQYILYRIRSEAVQALQPLVSKYQEPVDLMTPGLVGELEPVLSRVISEGTNTLKNLDLAQETEQVITRYFQQNLQDLQDNWQTGEEQSEDESEEGVGEAQDNSNGQSGGKDDSNDTQGNPSDMVDNDDQGDTPSDPGASDSGAENSDRTSSEGRASDEMAGGDVDGRRTEPSEVGSSSAGSQDISKETYDVLNQVMQEMDHGDEQEDLSVSSKLSEAIDEKTQMSHVPMQEMHTVGPGSDVHNHSIRTLSTDDIAKAVQASAALDAQLQSLLQTFVLNRGGVGRAGKLDTNKLHRLAVGNDRIFKRRVEKRGIDTEVVLCIDMSGSMQGEKAIITSKALYAVMKSLRRIQGCVSSAIGFAGNTIIDIIRAQDKLTDRMRLDPDGGTQCGEALMQAMLRFTANPESRKIVVMMTDGDTYNGNYFKQAIASARSSGIELVGIGIVDKNIRQYLKAEECCIINNLGQMVPELFRILRGKFLGGY